MCCKRWWMEFGKGRSFNQPLNKWDVSKVTNIDPYR